MADLEDFRTETREWLEANCPAEMRQPVRSEKDYCWGGRGWTFQSDAQRQWLEAMAERGWTVPDWPRDYGGGGLTPAEAIVLKEEMARIGARPPLDLLIAARSELPARQVEGCTTASVRQRHAKVCARHSSARVRWVRL